MAVTPSTLTELTDLAKDYFSDVYVPLMNTETPLKSQFAKLENAMFTGKKWIFGVKTAVGGSASNAGANKTLPAADEGQYDQGDANVVRTYVRMALDGLAIEVTKKQAGSYRPAVAEVMADRLQAIDLEVNRQLYCNADGKLCMIQATAASATQAVEKDYGITNGGPGAKHIYAGDQLALYDSGGTLIGRKTVVSVDQSASPNTVTLDSSITSTATTNYFSKSTADDDNKTAGEANGLLASVKDSVTFESIPATGRWKATRVHNSGVLRDISDSLVMQTIATVREKSRKTPNLAVTTPGIQLKYSEIFLPIRRIDGQSEQLKGGYKPVAYIQHGGGQIPLVVDSDCPNYRMFFLSTDAFRMADLVGTDWADLDGGVFNRVTDKDAIEGYVRKYWQLITVQRNANAVLEDINDTESINRMAA